MKTLEEKFMSFNPQKSGLITSKISDKKHCFGNSRVKTEGSVITPTNLQNEKHRLIRTCT